MSAQIQPFPLSPAASAARNSPLAPTSEIIAEIKAGRIVILVDE